MCSGEKGESERESERERRKRKSEERKRDLSLVLVRENRRSTGIEGSFRGVPFSFRHFVSPRHERQESSIETHTHTRRSPLDIGVRRRG